jgi:cell division protein FtsB
MRMRRRVSRNFSLIVIPAICCAVSLYFGYAGIFGERGLNAWSETRADLAMAKSELAAIRAKREALEHRISLLDDRAIDPDLLEEVARGVLLETRPGDVSVPREKR